MNDLVGLKERKNWARTVVRRLRKEYPDAECALLHRNPYELTAATILSAQCTDEMVNRVTPKLFRRYPTPQKLARARQTTVEVLVHSTGFSATRPRTSSGWRRRSCRTSAARCRAP